MLSSILKCLTPWTHDYGWPISGQQTCVVCGRTRAASVDLAGEPRLNIPRYAPKAQEGAAPLSKLIQIRRRRKA